LQQPAPSPSPSPSPAAQSCPVDTNGNYTINWTYTKPSGGPNPVGFRVQEATRSESVYFDNADEPLVAGANSKWADTGTPPQWSSQINPDTGSLAYFVQDNADQNAPLTMIGSVTLPSGGATLSFYSREETEEGFDFSHVDIATADNNFTSFSTIASFTGNFSGTRFLDLSPYSGKAIRLRFRLTSDLLIPGVGWHVEDIRLSSDDFRTIADTSPAVNSVNITGRTTGTYSYRIAALFDNPNPPRQARRSSVRTAT
jgi:hypothetical protein